MKWGQKCVPSIVSAVLVCVCVCVCMILDTPHFAKIVLCNAAFRAGPVWHYLHFLLNMIKMRNFQSFPSAFCSMASLFINAGIEISLTTTDIMPRRLCNRLKTHRSVVEKKILYIFCFDSNPPEACGIRWFDQGLPEMFNVFSFCSSYCFILLPQSYESYESFLITYLHCGPKDNFSTAQLEYSIVQMTFLN